VARYVFITGTGRTATTYLSKYFQANVPGCLSVHEPSRKIKIYSNRFVAGRASEARMRQVLGAWRRNVDRQMSAVGAELFFQVDPWVYGFTGLLDEVFDAPHVVHLVRHPYTYVSSHLNRIYRDAWISFVKRRLIPYWLLRGDQAGDYARSQWRGLAHEQQMAWYWVKCNGFVDENAGRVSRFMRVRFEDLFDAEARGLERIMEFCGVEALPPQRRKDDIDRNTAAMKFAGVADWPAPVRRGVQEMCQPLMEKFGYQE